MEWISVKDRLPKNGEYVLVLWGMQDADNDDPGMSVLKRHDIVEHNHKHKICGYGWSAEEHGCSLGINATHWMPLPPPPNQEV